MNKGERKRIDDGDEYDHAAAEIKRAYKQQKNKRSWPKKKGPGKKKYAQFTRKKSGKKELTLGLVILDPPQKLESST